MPSQTQPLSPTRVTHGVRTLSEDRDSSRIPLADIDARRAAARTGAPVERHSILVLDDTARVPQWFRDHFGTAYNVVGADSIAAAIDALERQKIGVIVTGETLGGESMLTLLPAFRQRYPMLMVVMLTATGDPDLVVRLIAELKVCRVLFKPVMTGAVDLALEAALRMHVACRVDPALSRREPVFDRGFVADDRAARPSLLERVRMRRGWLARLRGDAA